MKKILLSVLIVIVLCIIFLIAYKFLLINPVDSVVDSLEYLGNQSNVPDIYGTAPSGVFYSPINIEVAEIDKLMLVDVEDDPEYVSIELQTFDDTRGQGAKVILYRHNGSADSYYSNLAFLMKVSKNDTFNIDPDMTYHFKVTASGLDASLKMQDRDGKLIEFQAKETQRKKWSKGFLAPIGASEAIPFEYFPFFHMKDMNFVLREGSEIKIKIAGEERKPKKLPLPVDWEFVYLSRYTAQPILGCWNKPHNGDLPPFKPDNQMAYQDEQTHYELINNSGYYEIQGINALNTKHQVNFEFSPPIPDLISLKTETKLTGRFCAGADGIEGIIAGEYNIIRQGNIIHMEIQPLEGWHPIPGTIWVKSWTWKSTITVTENSTISMNSAWTRK
jgi:hypothetical protein